MPASQVQVGREPPDSRTATVDDGPPTTTAVAFSGVFAMTNWVAGAAACSPSAWSQKVWGVP